MGATNIPESPYQYRPMYTRLRRWLARPVGSSGSQLAMGATASSLVEEAWAPILGLEADTATVRRALARIRASSSAMRREIGAEGIAGGIQRVFHEDAIGLHPALKVEAAATLEKLCRVPENRTHIMESNFGPDLCMTLLQSTSESMDLKVHTLAVIAHLASEEEHRRPLMHEGLLEVVISEINTAFNAITAKRMFGAGPQVKVYSKEMAAEQGAAKAAVDAEVRLATLWLVNALAAFEQLASNAVVGMLALDKGALPALTRAARCDALDVKLGALRAGATCRDDACSNLRLRSAPRRGPRTPWNRSISPHPAIHPDQPILLFAHNFV